MDTPNESRKSVNFEQNAEMNVYKGGWDDDFDDDSDEDLEVETLPNKKMDSEKIELKEIEPVNIRNQSQRFQVPVQDKRLSTSANTAKQMGSRRLSRRCTEYDLKPENFAFDPTLASPIEARVCTDICCFMLFFVFLAIWAFSACLVFNMGNLERFAIPTITYTKENAGLKSDRICGEANQIDFQYELNFNLFKCLDPLVAFRSCGTKSLCVEHCPDTSFSFPYHRQKKNYNGTDKIPYELLKAIQCIGDPTLTTMEDIEKSIKDNRCAEITTKSFILNGSDYRAWQYKCIPDIFGTEIDFIIDLLDNIVSQTNIPWRITFEFIKIIGAKSSTLYKFSDMLEGWPVLIVFLMVALILTLIMVYSMKFFAKFIFIIANVCNAAILSQSIYMCYSRGAVFKEFSFNLFKNDVWGLLLIFSSIVAIIVLVQYCFERRGTAIILELIKEATNAIQYIKTLLIFPLIFYCIRAAAILLSMYIGFTIKSTSETDFKLSNNGPSNASCDCNGYVDGGFCNPAIISECKMKFPNCKLACTEIPDSQKLHENLVGFSELTNLVGYFWASEYLYLLEHAILASTYATYYWTFHKKDIPRFSLFNGFYTSVRYHLGTIFFAWLFICFYSYIRFEFKAIDGVLGLLPFSIVHFFFKYVVIVMALCGDDFYESAKEVVTIVKKNTRLIIISKCMSEILFFYLKLLITGVMGLLMYCVVLCFSFISPGYFKNDLFPVYLVCMGTYLIATEIFNIYILGVDTFTFCYIEDISINNGDMESPYFMPRPLMRICNLKNKLENKSYDNHV